MVLSIGKAWRVVDAGRAAKRPRPASTGARALPIAIVVVALASATIGVVVTARQLSGHQRPLSTTVTLGGLTTQVNAAGWIEASHDMPMAGNQPGYQMPPQMMPGMPTGEDVRLSIPITLRNTGGVARRFDTAQEFTLRGGHEAEARTLHSDTFGGLARLDPGSAADGVLYFDATVPGPDDPPLYLEWQRGSGAARLAVPLGGPTPSQHHG